MRRVIFSVLLFAITTGSVYASDYILPYPSFMPGSMLYKVAETVDIVQRYWHFGSIGKVKYYSHISDKKLVESLVLFEYKQYPLALHALHASNESFVKIHTYIEKGEEEGKDMSEFQKAFDNQTALHTEKLERVMKTLPDVFVWDDEFTGSMELQIVREIESALRVREQL